MFEGWVVGGISFWCSVAWSSSCAWSKANAPGKQEKRKRETKTKRGVTAGNDKKELQWGGGRAVATVAGREPARAQ